MQQREHIQQLKDQPSTGDDLNLVDLVMVLAKHWRQMIGVPVVVGSLAFGASFLITPQFTAKTTFIPPQGTGNSLNAALSALGPFSGLVGGIGATKGSGELYVSLLQSDTISDRLIDRFKLKELYKAQFQFETRDILRNRSRIAFGKRDGIITLEVDDSDPRRAAEIANQYVEELRIFTANMALTSAQRQRAFFEGHLKLAKDRLAEAQRALQGSGFNQGALRAEPRAAAEEYGRIKAELTSTEVRLGAIKSRLADRAPEVVQLAATQAALRQKLQTLEQKSEIEQGQDYVSKYREFKYQESLFDQLAKQFEAARLEESREDASIQVVDLAEAPEWKSKPKRASIGVAAFLIALLGMGVYLIARHIWRIESLAHRS